MDDAPQPRPARARKGSKLAGLRDAACLLAILAGLPGRAAASEPGPCLDRLRDALAAEGLAVALVERAAPGGVLVLLGPPDRPTIAAWAGRDENRVHVSSRPVSSRPTDADTAAEDVARQALVRAFPADCPDLRVQGPPGLDVQNLVDATVTRLLQAQPPPDGASLRPGIAPPPQGPHLTWPAVAKWLVLAEWLAYLALLCLALVRATRRHPADVALALGLAIAAAAVRFLSSPRVTIGAVQADLTHLVTMQADRATWFDNPITAYPPAWTVFLNGVFQFTGPDARVAFVATTIAGSLCAATALGIARQLTRSRLAGVLAGLALVAWPAAIVFANGLSLEVPAALLGSLTLLHLLRFARHRQTADAVLAALAGLLFLQTRLESAFALMGLAIATLAALWQEGAFAPAARRWPLAAGAVLLAIPYLHEVTGQAERPESWGGKLAGGLCVLAAAGIAARLLDRVLVRSRHARIAWIVAVVAAAAAFVCWAALTDGPVLLAAPWPDPGHPYQALWARGLNLRDLGILPLAGMVLTVLALLPAGDGQGHRLHAAIPVMLILPFFGQVLTGYVISTGIVTMEGVRHHALWVGIAAAGIGIGAYRVHEALRRLVPVPAAAAVAVLLVLSPLATHHAFYTSQTDNNTVREFEFVRDALPLLPAEFTVIEIDDPYTLGPRTMPMNHVIRQGDLWGGLAWTTGQKVRMIGWHECVQDPSCPEGEAFFYAPPECAGGYPSCAEARAASSRTIAEAVFPNRVYDDWSAEVLRHEPTIRMAILSIPAEALARLREQRAPPAK